MLLSTFFRTEERCLGVLEGGAWEVEFARPDVSGFPTAVRTGFDDADTENGLGRCSFSVLLQSLMIETPSPQEDYSAEACNLTKTFRISSILIRHRVIHIFTEMGTPRPLACTSHKIGSAELIYEHPEMQNAPKTPQGLAAYTTRLLWRVGPRV